MIVSEIDEFDWPAFEIVYAARGERYYGELDRPLVIAARIGAADAADAGAHARVRRS